MQIHSCEAIILRHFNYGEADRIVTFLTPDDGVRKGFARHARNSRKRFGTALEPFAQVRLHYSLPRSGELLALKEAELLDLRVGLRDNLAAIALAGYGCELVEGLLDQAHGHPEVFVLLRAFLDHLLSAEGLAGSRLLFELRLLAMAGYVPHLLHCSECGETLRTATTAFAAARGGSLCLGCAAGGPVLTLSLPTLGSLARSLQTPPNLFAGFRFGPRTLAEGGAALADALAQHLHRPLRSRAFLEQVLPPTGAPGPI